MTAADTTSALEQLRGHEHAACLLCGASDRLGLHLQVARDGIGQIKGHAIPGTELQSYPDELHGGIISLLMDGIMTNCLFAEGIVAVTAQLKVRYLRSVQTGIGVVLTATLAKSKRNVHYVEAFLRQDGELKVKGWGTFIERPSRRRRNSPTVHR